MARSKHNLTGGLVLTVNELAPATSGQGVGRPARRLRLPALPVHKPANAVGLSLAGNELLFVTQRDEPALAA